MRLEAKPRVLYRLSVGRDIKQSEDCLWWRNPRKGVPDGCRHKNGIHAFGLLPCVIEPKIVGIPLLGT